jgi:DNA repair exonuclease SbcCD ATPase subunit
MNKGLIELLESSVLNEETKAALQEAWNAKLDEVRASLREEVEAEVRGELAERFENDKSNLVEAMDNMLTDAVKKYAAESVEATRKLDEERAALTTAIKEARAGYKAQVTEHAGALQSFVLNQLKEELAELAEDHKAIQAQRVTDAKKLREHRTALNEAAATRINQLEGFVLEQVKKELAELNEDRQALVDAKVRLVAESKAKLDETKKAFIARASDVVGSTVEAHLRRELTKLKEEIKEARENRFGRNIFEAFQAEFMTSYLSEGSEVRKLAGQLNESKEELAQATETLAAKDNEIAQAVRRAKLAEDRATRVATITQLVAPLNKDNKQMMLDLLDGVKTAHLKEAFNKYLPGILNEGARAPTQGRRVLSETTPVTETATKALTGDRANRLAESARAEEVSQSESQDEIVNLRRLAGLE